MSEPPNVALRPSANTRRTCPYCRAALGLEEATWTCPTCGVGHHAECASENTRCAIHGCGTLAPLVAQASASRIRITPRAAAPVGPVACVACRSGIGLSEVGWLCPACEQLHHDDCARNLGRCAGCGRLRTPGGARMIPEEPPPPVSARLVGLALSLVFLGVSLAHSTETVWEQRSPRYWTHHEVETDSSWLGVVITATAAAISLCWGRRPFFSAAGLLVFAVVAGLCLRGDVLGSFASFDTRAVATRTFAALVTFVIAGAIGLWRNQSAS